MSALEFKLQLDREWLDKQEDIADAVAALALQGLFGVVNKSPVKTGRFKGNWTASIGQFNMTATQEVDPSGGATIAEGAAILSGYQSTEGFPVIYLQNNLEYAEPLENGHSKQAPGGMVGLTIAELSAQWNATDL